MKLKFKKMFTKFIKLTRNDEADDHDYILGFYDDGTEQK